MAHASSRPDPAAGRDVVIETRGFTKKYGRFLALDNVSMDIPHASIGLLGANGAGKSTLIRSLLGIIPPSGGSARVVGYDTRRDGIKVREHVGYMPEADALPMNTSAADFVGHMGEMSGLPPKQARQRASDVLYHVGLGEERNRLISGFSTGMRQRVKLAQAIVHDPKLVFLDEPTAGMDPQGRDDMLELVQRIYTRMGMSVVFSSHILEDIERVCDYVVILDNGKVLTAQPLNQQDDNLGQATIELDGDRAAFMRALQSRGVRVEDYESDTTGKLLLLVDVHDERIYDEIRDVAVEQRAVIRSLRSRSRSLEDMYLGNVNASREVTHGA